MFGSGLPAKFWSSALIHLVYLHNQLVHTVMKKTSFEAYFGVKPDLTLLKLFGSCVCIKQSGSHQSKLNHHDFKGIFLGYTATDQNIVYLDLDSGVVKCSHHAQFDESWYLQPTCPPAPRLLYDLGVTHEETEETEPSPVSEVISDYCTPGTVEKVIIPWPPIASNGVSKSKWDPPMSSLHIHLPLCALTEELPRPITACTAQAKSMTHKNTAAELVSNFKIGKQDMALVYMLIPKWLQNLFQNGDFPKWIFFLLPAHF